MIYWFSRSLCRLIFFIFFRLRIEGDRHFPRRGGFLLAGNHVSFLDPAVFGSACPNPLRYMARDTLFQRPLFGWYLRQIHAFPLRRNAADLGAIKEGFRWFKSGSGLLIFPEGTRQPDGKIGPAHAGVGFLARKSGVPVIPSYVHNTDKAMPKGSGRIRLARLQVIFGEPVTRPQDGSISDEAFAQEVMRRIESLKAKIR